MKPTFLQISAALCLVVSSASHADTQATASSILDTIELWDAPGNKITGSMPNRGSINLSSSMPGAGYYGSIATHLPNSSQLANGVTFLGVTGTTTFNSSIGVWLASTANRDVASAQISNLVERQANAFAANYREIMRMGLDDNGKWTAADGCTGAGGFNQTCSADMSGTRPTVECGTPATMASDNLSGKSDAASIDQRIAHCADASRNGANATWDGGARGNNGQGVWKLVTRTSDAKEIWRDERTQLIWSAPVNGPGGVNWCQAAGNHQADDPSNVCNNGAYQNQVTPVSYCAEAAGLSPGDGTENWNTGVYSNKKGGMGKVPTATSPSVYWRLPTRYDFQRAEIDGIRFAMPNPWGWSGTVFAKNRLKAFWFKTQEGSITTSFYDRTSLIQAICVGRY